MMTSPKIVDRQAFADFEGFRVYTQAYRLVFFHVFTGQPDPQVYDALSTWSPHEALLLLEVNEDQGFLRQTLIAAELTKGKNAASRPLVELRGLGAWADRAIVGFTEDPALFEKIVRDGRNAISTKVATLTRKACRSLQTMNGQAVNGQVVNGQVVNGQVVNGQRIKRPT